MSPEPKNDVPLPPEIAKYSAILSKDPNSMVFAPLAEAYRKAGMLDEAIKTAQDGLKLHPNYLSGMVALGRACFDKGMLKEAAAELEQVIKIAPDNVIAKNILEEIKKQWPVVSGQESEVPLTPILSPGGRGSEAEPEAAELVELEEVEEVAELEEVEEVEKARPVFGEEISEELWTGETIPEKKAEPKRGITTETIAELYIKQGYLGKAIDIYQTLYDADPYNEEIRAKLEELKSRQSAVGSQESESSGQWSVISGQQNSKPEEPEIRKSGIEDENVKRLEAWLKSIQSERRKG